MRHFPDFIDAYLDYTKYHEASAKIHKWVAISIVASALERKVWMNRGFYLLFPNLYTIIVGQSGLVKKSTSTAIGINLLRELKGLSLLSERMTATSFLRQMSESHKQFEYQGKKVSQSSVTAYASELRVFMEEVFGSMSELLTTFFDCQPNDPSKPWKYRNIKDGETLVFGPCLNILGASTPAWLTRCISPEDMEGGFASRCIFVAELGAPETPVAWPEMTIDLNDKRIKLTEDLKRIYNIVGVVHVEQQAKDFFEKWYINHTKEVIPKNADSRFAGYLGRKGDQILKLAMIKSVAQGDDLIVKEPHIKWALEALEELEPSMKYVFDTYDPNVKKTLTPMGTSMDLADEILSYISELGPVEIGEVRKMYLNQHNVENFSQTMTELIMSKKVKQEQVKVPNSNFYVKMLSVNQAESEPLE